MWVRKEAAGCVALYRAIAHEGSSAFPLDSLTVCWPTFHDRGSCLPSEGKKAPFSIDFFFVCCAVGDGRERERKKEKKKESEGVCGKHKDIIWRRISTRRLRSTWAFVSVALYVRSSVQFLGVQQETEGSSQYLCIYIRGRDRPESKEHEGKRPGGSFFLLPFNSLFIRLLHNTWALFFARETHVKLLFIIPL